MNPIINEFLKLEDEGYEVEIDIDDEYDIDDFGEGEVCIVRVHLKATKVV